VFQTHEPVFNRVHVLVKVVPGAKSVPSGMVSDTNLARSQGIGMGVGAAVGGTLVGTGGSVGAGAAVGAAPAVGAAADGAAGVAAGAAAVAGVDNNTPIASTVWAALV